jgi:hypothetical protein
MELKAGEPIKNHKYFGIYKLNYEILYFSELIDNLAFKNFIFANGIIEKCKDIDDWSLGKVKLYLEKGWFWDIIKE